MFQSRNLRNALLTLLLMLVSLGLVYVMSLTTALSFTGQPSLRNAGSRNKLLSETVGVFVEARPLSNMIPVLLYFAGYLGPTWPIHVFHSLENAPLLNSSSAISAHVARGSIILHLLPEGTALTSHDAVSQFLTSTWIWTTLLPATHALLFQADSILCGASMLRPENFLQYAFVGAPIDPKFGTGYNGGLSLRHIPTMLRAISTFKWSDTRLFEDQWFAKAIPKLTDPPAPPLPTTEEARLFSVETIWADQPMGYHQAKRWNAARMPEIIRWCPEITLAGEGTLY
ncbi:hypothetical protein DFJ77DRAFT_107495 [Powellomyces hirtus]|nr:hypothetical protein DFJ77DRAFT_107495 [Powellomyces hirtus]